MVRGFYSLTSGMLTQNRMLDTVSNNIANANTNGFKAQHLTSKTFGDMMVERLDGSSGTPVGSMPLITTVDKSVTDFSRKSITQTGRALDFALQGDGFFAVQTPNGVAYTRNGSFDVDAGGYLTLNGVGRVLGKNGQPLRPGTDNLTSDGLGNLTANGAPAGSIGVFRFADNAALTVTGEGLFQGGGATVVQQPQIEWRAVEDSNTDMAGEMTRGIEEQRSLQSCSQVLKMYDTILDKATDIGRI